MFDWCPRPERDNGIGLCGDQNAGDDAGTIGFMHSFIDAMADLGFSWLKLLMNVDHKSGRLALIEHARRKNIMVIARPFRQPCHPRGLDLYDDFIRALVDRDCRYTEIGNEPNLAAIECWKLYPAYTYGDVRGHAAFVNLLYDQWCSEADKVRRLGGIPLFPGMSPTAYTNDEVFFHHALYEQIIGLGKLRGDLGWAFEGAGIAIHNRPCGNPLDDLGACSFRDYEWIEAQFKVALGREIPLFGTESGYEDGMVGTYILHQLGNLYPNNEDYIRYHKILNHEMFARFNPQHPKAWHDYLICQCAWLAADNGWYASGWARNARVGGGALPSFTDMGQISRFTRAEGVPYEPPEEEPEPPAPELPPGTDEIDFVGLSQEMIDMLCVSGPLDPNQPYWKVTAVEVQPNTDNMNAWVLVPDKPHPTPVFFWPGMEVPMEWKGPDPLSPPGCQNGAYAQVMHHCWGSFGVRMDGNTEALFGIGLYGANLETTYTGHHPVLVYFEQVSPAEPPGPPEPPVDPDPDIPPAYSLKARLEQAPHGFEDMREQVKSVEGVDMEWVKAESLDAGRIDEYGEPLFGNLRSIVLHHLGGDYAGALNLVYWAVNESEKVKHCTSPYHFVVEKSGRIMFMVAVKYLTHHAYGANDHGIGIVFEDEANEKQMEAGRFLIAALYEFFGQGWGQFRLTGLLPHSMVWNGEDWLNDCPGDVWPRILWSGPFPKLRAP